MVAVGMVGLLEGHNDGAESLEGWLVHGFEVLPQDLVEVIHGWDRLRAIFAHEALQRVVRSVGDVLANFSWLPVFLLMSRGGHGTFSSPNYCWFERFRELSVGWHASGRGLSPAVSRQSLSAAPRLGGRWLRPTLPR